MGEMDLEGTGRTTTACLNSDAHPPSLSSTGVPQQK